MNSIFVIQPFRKYGTWVFNDEARNIVEEPFVIGMPQILDRIINDRNCVRFTAVFSADELPEYDILLEKDNTKVNAMGTWYKCERIGMSGWLCPVLNIYFPKSPEKIYIKIENKLT